MSLASLLGSGRAKTPRNSIDVSEAAGVRYLHFGSEWVQGAMRVARPFALELEYTREMMLPLLFAPHDAWPARVLVIGLGAGSITKFLHRYCPQSDITVVEIDPAVIALREAFMVPPDSERFQVVQADALTIHDARGVHDHLVYLGQFDGAGTEVQCQPGGHLHSATGRRQLARPPEITGGLGVRTTQTRHDRQNGGRNQLQHHDYPQVAYGGYWNNIVSE
mgnify:CR=1 FL=1